MLQVMIDQKLLPLRTEVREGVLMLFWATTNAFETLKKAKEKCIYLLKFVTIQVGYRYREAEI